jgi:hypothetical protein
VGLFCAGQAKIFNHCEIKNASKTLLIACRTLFLRFKRKKQWQTTLSKPRKET